jgi:EcsC protein family
VKHPIRDRLSPEALLSRFDPADVERVARAMLDSVDGVAKNRWDVAKKRAAALPGDIRPEKIAALRKRAVRELTVAGAAAGAASAAPAVGTIATLMATTAELAWFTSRAGDVILTMAALHGHNEPTEEERRGWVLALLIYGGSARDGLAKALNEASTGVALPAEGRFNMATLQTANRLLGSRLLRRYGAKRGAVAVGRILPLGIGALIGGGANYKAISSLIDNADKFFSKLPYSYIETTGTKMAPQLPPPDPSHRAR